MLPTGLTKEQLEAALATALAVLNKEQPAPKIDRTAVLAESKVRCSGGLHTLRLLTCGKVISVHHPMGAIAEEKVLQELGSLHRYGELRCAEVVRLWRVGCRSLSREVPGRLPTKLCEMLPPVWEKRGRRVILNSKPYTNKLTASRRNLTQVRILLAGADWLVGEAGVRDSLPTMAGSGCALVKVDLGYYYRGTSLYKRLKTEKSGWYLVSGEDVLAGPLTSRTSWADAQNIIEGRANGTL